MKFKKIFSFVLSAVMLFSFAPLYSTQNGSAMAVENTDPPTFMENEPTLTADSSLGSFITNAMKSEDIIEAGEQDSEVQYSGDYGIEDVTYDTETNTLSLFTWQIEDCTAIVGFYSDDGKRMYTSEKVEISKDDEITTFDVDTTKLPESFLVEAYLINDQLMPLCNSYVYNKMTKEMQEILAKTVNDFDPELVVQIDETDDTNNFYVLNDNTILIDSNSETNTIVSADFETGTYVFSNIDDSMRELSEGDIFSVATDLGVIAAQVENITIDDDIATIVGTSDEEELFQFVKIDTSEMDPSLLNDYTVDMSGADEGVSLSDKSFDETEIPDEDTLTGQETAEDNFASIGNLAPETLNPKGEEQASVGLTAEPTFTIAEKKAGASGNGFSGKVNLVVSVPVEIKVEFYFSLGYSSFELNSGYAIKAKGSASVSGELKIPLGQYAFPVAGVLHLGVFPKIVVSGSVEASITFQRSFSAGFKWDTNTWELNKCDGLNLSCENKIECNLEASLFIGLELEFKGFIISTQTCSLSFPLDIGQNIHATLPVALVKTTDTFDNGTFENSLLHIYEGSSDQFPDKLYNCDIFVEIDVDFQVKLSGELKIADFDWNPLKDKMKIKADIFEWTKNLGRFYFAVYPDSTGARKAEFGRWDELSGKDFILYKTTVKVYDEKHDPLSGALVNYGADADAATDKNGEVVYYLPPGQYRFTCNMGEKNLSKYTEIINIARTVSFVMGDNSGDPGDPTDPDSPEAQESLEFLTYKQNDEGGITITDCKQNVNRTITIPREIDGKPVTSIGERAFDDCRGLTSITLPETLTSIEYRAFTYCWDLKYITIPDSVTSIAKGAFESCSSLTTVTIPDGVTSIEPDTFDNCICLTDIKIPDSVKNIGEAAFCGCHSLTSITIPESVNNIGESAFAVCEHLTTIAILNPDCQIYDDAATISNPFDPETSERYFNGTIYGYTGSTAQAYAEKYGYNFESLDAALAAISTPSYLPSMKKADEPAEVEFTFTQEVPDADIYNFYVFADENAEDLLAKDNLLYIKQVQVTPDSLTVEIPYILDGEYPDKTEKLVRYEAPDSGLVLDESAEDGTVSLIDYAGSAEELTIPAEINGKSVAAIDSGAFEGCTSLVSVVVPASVSSIGECAFAGCENLNAITIQNPDCEISDSAYTICNGFDEESGEPFFNGTIFGYEGSTALAYAEKYGYTFKALDEVSPEEQMLGDIDGDGTIDSTDASEILTEYAATQTGAEPTLDKSIADVNSDGFVDSTDASDILQFYAYTSTGGTDSLSEFLRTR